MFRTTRWFLRELERRDRAHEAREDALLNRIMYLADRPWTPAPIEEEPSDNGQVGLTIMYPEDFSPE